MTAASPELGGPCVMQHHSNSRARKYTKMAFMGPAGLGESDCIPLKLTCSSDTGRVENVPRI